MRPSLLRLTQQDIRPCDSPSHPRVPNPGQALKGTQKYLQDLPSPGLLFIRLDSAKELFRRRRIAAESLHQAGGPGQPLSKSQMQEIEAIIQWQGELPNVRMVTDLLVNKA